MFNRIEKVQLARVIQGKFARLTFVLFEKPDLALGETSVLNVKIGFVI